MFLPFIAFKTYKYLSYAKLLEKALAAQVPHHVNYNIYLIDATTNNFEKALQPLAMSFWERRYDYLGYTNNTQNIIVFQPIWKYRNVPKWLVLCIEDHKNNPRTLTIPSKHRYLRFWTIIHRKRDRSMYVAISCLVI